MLHSVARSDAVKLEKNSLTFDIFIANLTESLFANLDTFNEKKKYKSMEFRESLKGFTPTHIPIHHAFP